MDTTTEHGGGEFRKTATIRATQWWKMGDHPAVVLKNDLHLYADNGIPWCPTLEGGHVVTPGDWIATGVQGEHWPIKADVFAATYEPVASRPAQPAAPDPSADGGGGGAAHDAALEVAEVVYFCDPAGPPSTRRELAYREYARALASRTPAPGAAGVEIAVAQLRKAADQFAFYADEHAKKGTPEGDAKGATNHQWALACARAASEAERAAARGAGV